MILLLHDATDSYCAEIVRAALLRSFTSAQVTVAKYGSLSQTPAAAVLINPGNEQRELVTAFLTGGRKLLVLGYGGFAIGAELGLRFHETSAWNPEAARATVAGPGHYDASELAIQYTLDHELARLSPLPDRPLCRFDFLNEWNNFGFGRITTDGGPWSLAGPVDVDSAQALAWLTLADGKRLSAYAAMRETPTGAALWFNRPVGPVDSLEWRLVEAFFGDYRADDLICLPYLAEIPAGYQGAATMRLDCDEAVASARSLFELYASAGLPLSLALRTGQALDSQDHELLRDVIAAGGAVVSHSVNHLPNWGGDYQAARWEAQNSKQWIEETIPAASPVRFAVSPFHQNPAFAVLALADAGYEAFIGGSIANDPECLLGRAGQVPFVSRSIISHSQQCMLHGDCFHRYGNSVVPYIQSFRNHLEAQSIFGFLDHPFSSRYQYGWSSEQERLQAHATLIQHIQGQENVWWSSLNDCLSFLKIRHESLVHLDHRASPVVTGPDRTTWPPLAVKWKHSTLPA